MDNELKISPEIVEQNLKQFKVMMSKDLMNIEFFIESLPKQALTRLVKLYSGCAIAREIAELPALEFHANEEKLIKNGMKLQDDCLGYTQLTQELASKKQQGEFSGT